MSLIPKTNTYPACLGIACPLHARCARYAAVHGSEADPNTMGTCLSGTAYPEFVELAQHAATSAPQQLGDLAAQAGQA